MLVRQSVSQLVCLKNKHRNWKTDLNNIIQIIVVWHDHTCYPKAVRDQVLPELFFWSNFVPVTYRVVSLFNLISIFKSINNVMLPSKSHQLEYLLKCNIKSIMIQITLIPSITFTLSYVLTIKLFKSQRPIWVNKEKKSNFLCLSGNGVAKNLNLL